MIYVHDFTERRKFSQAMGDQEAAWCNVYRDAWPDMIAMVRADSHAKFQQWGIDRILYLPNGKQLTIDEKVRDPEKAKDRDGDPYDDILIEEISVFYKDHDQRNKIGWSLDPKKQCDYIAYAIPLLNRCYFLPFEMLRLACKYRLEEWKTRRDRKGRRCYPLFAYNYGYRTLNCGVSWADLQAGIAEQMRRVWCAGTLQLPSPTVQGQQAVFDWNQE